MVTYHEQKSCLFFILGVRIAFNSQSQLSVQLLLRLALDKDESKKLEAWGPFSSPEPVVSRRYKLSRVALGTTSHRLWMGTGEINER